MSELRVGTVVLSLFLPLVSGLAASQDSIVSRAGGESVAAKPAAYAPLAGDIVLSRGSGFWSDVFAGLNRRDRRYSHAGIVVNDGGNLKVVHAAADDDGSNGSVRLDGFDRFTAEAQWFTLLRLDDRAAAGRMASAALSMHAAALPFDFEFKLTNERAVYCSELVWHALTTALHRDPLPNKPFIADRQAVLIENFLLDMPELHVVEM